MPSHFASAQDPLALARHMTGPQTRKENNLPPLEETTVHQTVNVPLTETEIKGLRMALRFGVPTHEPEEIASARRKLEDAQGDA